MYKCVHSVACPKYQTMHKYILLLFSIFLFANCSSPKPILGSPNKPLKVTAENFQSDILPNKNVSVLYFWATWCGPCRMTGPIIEDMAKNEIGNTTYAKVNVDQNAPIAAKYGIRNIPSVVLLKNGEVVDMHVGTFTHVMIGNMVRLAYEN